MENIEPEGVTCTGRTRGDVPTKPVVTKLEKTEDGGLVLRIDDHLNPAAWIEVCISPERLAVVMMPQPPDDNNEDDENEY